MPSARPGPDTRPSLSEGQLSHETSQLREAALDSKSGLVVLASVQLRLIWEVETAFAARWQEGPGLDPLPNDDATRWRKVISTRRRTQP